MQKEKLNKWTINQIPDLSNKVAVVTGANSGLGKETTLELSRKHAKVIMACRNIDKAQKAFDEIKKEIPYATIKILQLDLGDLESIRSFSFSLHEYTNHLDLLINNAGVMATPFEKTKDGFEQQFGINHLGHYALTGLVLDLLSKAKNARVINVSSMAHKNGEIDFDDLFYEKGRKYTRFGAYAQSKLANVFFTYELQRFFDENNLDIISVAVHPGVADTGLLDHFPFIIAKKIFPFYKNRIQTAKLGAYPSLRAATDSNIYGGEYYGPDGLKNMQGYPVQQKSSNLSYNKDIAKRLWEVSKNLTDVVYQI